MICQYYPGATLPLRQKAITKPIWASLALDENGKYYAKVIFTIIFTCNGPCSLLPPSPLLQLASVTHCDIVPSNSPRRDLHTASQPRIIHLATFGLAIRFWAHRRNWPPFNALTDFSLTLSFRVHVFRPAGHHSYLHGAASSCRCLHCGMHSTAAPDQAATKSASAGRTYLQLKSNARLSFSLCTSLSLEQVRLSSCPGAYLSCLAFSSECAASVV